MKKVLLACSALALLMPFSAFAHETDMPHGGPKVEVVRPGQGDDTRKKAVFKGMDRDNDGAVSTQELIRGSKKRFAIKDVDHNGWLSLAEFQAEDPEGDDASGHGPDRDAEEQKGLADVRARRFERLDADGNGVLSEDEIIADGWDRHKFMDINEDGRVTLTEVDARRAEAQQKALRILQTSNGFPKRGQKDK
jgi:hypothetical protein